MDRKQILTKAINCVSGQREQGYGSYENNFEITATLWNDYINGQSEKDDCFFTLHDVAMMLALSQVAWITSGYRHTDNYVALAGYAAIAGELREREAPINKEDRL